MNSNDYHQYLFDIKIEGKNKATVRILINTQWKKVNKLIKELYVEEYEENKEVRNNNNKNNWTKKYIGSCFH